MYKHLKDYNEHTIVTLLPRGCVTGGTRSRVVTVVIIQSIPYSNTTLHEFTNSPCTVKSKVMSSFLKTLSLSVYNK